MILCSPQIHQDCGSYKGPYSIGRDQDTRKARAYMQMVSSYHRKELHRAESHEVHNQRDDQYRSDSFVLERVPDATHKILQYRL